MTETEEVKRAVGTTLMTAEIRRVIFTVPKLSGSKAYKEEVDFAGRASHNVVIGTESYDLHLFRDEGHLIAGYLRNKEAVYDVDVESAILIGKKQDKDNA